ncbi:hypothetical protein WG66_010568 [Moniliophthora roreri]|uniref:PNPLA domain-containing protein n=1 Tax=Moniliophthora roreri TaxID=221103 RepID=A0A0W0FC07_MONRR|nr:hypothetical protein WG66_010568 [Moniliophthora roreri]
MSQSPSQTQRPLRILSLDGGGYRGISMLTILKELMKQLTDPSGKEPKPCEVFDFIIGTSTGGLIALLLGRLGLSVDEAKEKYLDLGEKIFVGNNGVLGYILSGTTRYDTEILEGIFKDILGDEQLVSPGTVRTAVTTTLHERSVNDAILLRTYTDSEGALPPTSSSYSWTAFQAARATSAAPTYFKPITVDGMTFADAGAAGFNNPTEVGVTEVARIPVWRDRAIGAIVSLGTGLMDEAYTPTPLQNEIHLNPVAVPNAEPEPIPIVIGIFDWKKRIEKSMTYLVNVASDSEKTHNQMRYSHYKDVYWRFNVPTIGEYDLGDFGKGPEIESRTINYLQETATAAAMKKLVKVLKRGIRTQRLRIVNRNIWGMNTDSTFTKDKGNKSGSNSEARAYNQTWSRPWVSGGSFHHKLHAQDEDISLSDATTTFRTCVNIAGAYDADLCARWEKDIDALLVFAGLFSAVVTAFAVESYQTLQPDPNESVVRLLAHISLQLASPSTPALEPLKEENFTATSSSIRINIFYFLSLIFSLAAAHLSILCKQWMREYQREYPSHLNPRQMLAVRQSRHEGLHAWGVPDLIASIPLLLQVATALFFIGVVKMLWDINSIVATIVLVATIICLVFLVATTILAPLLLILSWTSDTFVHYLPWQCPYKTPLGWIIIRVTTPILLILNRALPSRRRSSFRRSMSAIIRYIQSLNWGMYDLKYCEGELYGQGMQKTMGWMYAFTSSGVFAECLRELDVESALGSLRDLMPFFIVARERVNRGDVQDAEKGTEIGTNGKSSHISTDVISVDILERFLDAASEEVLDEAIRKDIIDVSCLLFRRYAPSNARIRYCLEGCIRIINSISSAARHRKMTLPPSTMDIVIYLLEMYSGDLDDYFVLQLHSAICNASTLIRLDYRRHVHAMCCLQPLAS